MKHASAIILSLALLGAAVLVASAFYFGAPFFGWLIILAIFAIYIGAETHTYRGVRKIEEERRLLAQCAEKIPQNPEGSGLVASRIRLVQRLSSRGVLLDTQMIRDILDTREEANVGRSAGGVVILLGLMGTFFGLMLAVSTAGNSIEINTAPEATLTTIQTIFSSMKGIFGTSLCGVFAALVLNASHGIYLQEHTRFLADLDEFTLFDLIPAFTPSAKDTSSELHKLVEAATASTETASRALAENLRAAQAEVLDGMLKVQRESAAALQETLRGLSGDLAALLQGNVTGVQEAQERTISGLTETVKNYAQQMETLQKETAVNLQKSVAALSGEVAESVREQVRSSGEQWHQFMDSLTASADDAGKHQREGLDVLRSVAEDVASRAQEGSVGLSQSVAEEIGRLSREVQASFRELASASTALVESQKALLSGMENRVLKENEASGTLTENITEAASLMHVNQSEFAASLEMFRQGIEAVLEKLSGNSADRDGEQNFIEQLHLSLEAFHEKAGEVLMENAVKTQEILLEILEQSQRGPATGNKAEA